MVLEEIVGQIEDEHDNNYGDGITSTGTGIYYIEGKATIRDINRKLDWNIRDEEASTIAGLLMHECEAVPEEGKIISIDGISFEVLKRNKNQVMLIKAQKEPEYKE